MTATIAEQLAADVGNAARRVHTPAERSNEARLMERWYGEGDADARDALIRHFTPLAHRLASRYRATSESQDDLEQVACIGLIKAIDRYDPERGAFPRYAVPNILGELRRHFRDKAWTVHVPRSLQERFLKVNEATEALSGQLGRSPTPRDIAKTTGFSLEEVIEALDAGGAYSPAALDAPFRGEGDGDRTVGDTVGGDDDGFELVELRESVVPALRELPERERQILKLRFFDDLTQSEIAERIGISQMHVSRLLRRSLAKLNAITERGEEPASAAAA
jgi:RNA polymerase sigma-B factor